jgi:hypothetical protein
MERKGAVVVAVVAAVVNLVVIAAAGNQWYYDHVAIKSSSNGANATIKQVPVAFRWRLSHWSGDHNLRLGEVIASASVVVLVFLLTWVVIRSQRRPRGFFGPFLAIWGLEMLSAVVASMVGLFISYPGLFGGRANPLGTTRFWWSVIEGPAGQVIMWALCVGFIAALLCALITMGQKAEPFDEPGRPEDAFFPPRTPDLTAPPAAAVAAGTANPELAGYGWAPEEAAAKTQALPTTEGGEPARFEPPAEVPVAEDAPTQQHRLYAPPPEPEPTLGSQLQPPTESAPNRASEAASAGASDETRELPTTESSDASPYSTQTEAPRRPWPES